MRKENAPQNILFAVGALALLGFTVLISPRPARAQAEVAVAPSQTVTLQVNQAPVQNILKLLFTQSGKNYSLGPNVQGTVSVNLQNVSFDVALRAVLRASNPPLTSDVMSNTYRIQVKAPDAPAPVAQVVEAVPDAIHTYRLPIDSYDAYYLATMLQQTRGGLQVVDPNYVNPGPAAGAGNGRGTNGGRQGRQGGNGGRGRGPRTQ